MSDHAHCAHSEAQPGSTDPLKAQSLAQISAVWPALLDAIQPMLDEVADDLPPSDKSWNEAVMDCLAAGRLLSDAEYKFVAGLVASRPLPPSAEERLALARIHAKVTRG
ncbi:MAG: hypothetical protein U1E17_24850 [Geminicoccaceae bacterium]